jgi:hypothetical protein
MVAVSAVGGVCLGLLPAATLQTLFVVGTGAAAALYAGGALYLHAKGLHDLAKVSWGGMAAVGLLGGAAALLPAGITWGAYLATVSGLGLWNSAQAWSAHRLAGTAEEARSLVAAANEGLLSPRENAEHRNMLDWVAEFAGIDGDFSRYDGSPCEAALRMGFQPAQ